MGKISEIIRKQVCYSTKFNLLEGAEEAERETLSLFRRYVPKGEKQNNKEIVEVKYWKKGWNDFRVEVLRNIRKLKGGK